MKKIKLLSTLLFAGAFALGASQGAFAATSASQTCTGTLGTMKQVITNGGNIAATIDSDTGTLSAAFTPAFRITTNTNSSQSMLLSSTCNTSTVAQNAFFGDGDAGTTYIVLTNNTVLPTAAAVTDAKATTPVPANNGNVIVYGLTPVSDVECDLDYTWNNTNKNWDAALTNKGNTDTSLTVPAAAPKSLTYSYDDEPGSYQATITLSFV